MHRKLILASSSRYRRSLLERLQLRFESRSPDLDETPVPGATPAETARRLSLAKAQEVARTLPDGLVIGCDQTAEVDGTLLGKPGDITRATQQLHAMSGKTVIFWSGVALVDQPSGRAQLEVIMTRSTFRALTADEIARYVAAEPALDCAGSAKVEGLGIALMERIECDDPTALIGLPLIALTRMLRAFGVNVP